MCTILSFSYASSPCASSNPSYMQVHHKKEQLTKASLPSGAASHVQIPPFPCKCFLISRCSAGNLKFCLFLSRWLQQLCGTRRSDSANSNHIGSGPGNDNFQWNHLDRLEYELCGFLEYLDNAFVGSIPCKILQNPATLLNWWLQNKYCASGVKWKYFYCSISQNSPALQHTHRFIPHSAES